MLRIQDLKVDIQTEEATLHVLRGVTLSLGENAALGLVGESGCGKSTTAMSVLRLLPKNATIVAGQILLGQLDLTHVTEQKMRSIRGTRISLIFQSAAASLNPLLTGAQHVADVYARHSGATTKEARRRAVDLLAMTGIGIDHANSYPHELSGGMCQRVMIAMALACSPDILIADEPTTGLDITIQIQVIELIEESANRLGASLLYISHDIGLVSEICTQMAVMYAGRIIEIGRTEQITSTPAHPYTLGLLRSFRDQSGTRMPFIPGRVPDPRTLQPGCSFAPRCRLASTICSGAVPKMQEIEPGHLAACHHLG